MIYGTRRLWCDETINGVLGIDDRHVAFRGHSTTFVFDHRDGSRVTGVDPHSITSGDPALCKVDRGGRDQFSVSADGRWVAAASFGSRLRVFDNTTGEMKFAEDPPYGFDELALSHDGALVAGLADGVYVFGSGVHHRIPGLRWGPTFDAGGDVIGGNVGKVVRCGLDGGERARVSIRHKIESLSVSRDGRYAAVTTMCTGGLCMWPMPDVVVADLARGAAILRFHDKAELDRIAALSPDARWLALIENDRTRLMPAAPRPPWSVPPVVASWPEQRLVMTPGDRALLVDYHGNAELIELPSGTRLGGPWKFDGSVTWSARGFVELSLDQQRVRFRDSRTFEVIAEHGFECRIDAFAVSHDGTQLAITDGPTIQITRL